MWEVNSSETRLDDDPTGASSDARTSAVFTPDGLALISGCQDGPLRQYNADSGEVEVVFPERLRRAFCVAFSPNSTQLATGGHMRDVTLYCLPQPGGVAAKSVALRGHSVGVNALNFSPCGRWLATGGSDKTVRVWDGRSETGTMTSLLSGHLGSVLSTTFSPDGTRIASGCAKGEIRLWEIGSNDGEFKSTAVFNSGSEKKCFVAYLPGSSQLASSHGEGDIQLWDDDQLQRFKYLLKQDIAIDRFAFSSCGRWLTTVHDRVVRLWKVLLDDQEQADQDQNKYVSVIEGFSGTVRGIAWRPNKLEFTTACWDGSLRVWQLMQEGQTGKVNVQQVWSSGHAVLAASGALLNNKVQLSVTNKKLLQQLGAISSSAE
ncbi:hypothetical protein EC991_004042 [Linnemannia zychae]|nr:hypothetical protein EC991_004042 [Linnemannia zychae]